MAENKVPRDSSPFPTKPVEFPSTLISQNELARRIVNPRRGARLRLANRSQIEWGRIDLDVLLPHDHPARAIWAVVGQLDLSELYAKIRSRDSIAGAPAIDPKVLLALWVYATSEGEGSAREIWRLTEVHAAYRWLCGGAPVGYHRLSDFRSQEAQTIDQLITQVLALLMQQELVDLGRIAQDGTRVRASAGAGSFRKTQTLQALMEEARQHLEAVKRESTNSSMTVSRAAARKRGAEDRLRRLEAALAQLPEVEITKKQSGAKDKTPRVSTTDPEARVMKMGDGGFRPAFNVQFATTTDKARVVVGVDVTNRGTDANATTPMLEQVERRTGVRPKEVLADGGYAQHEAIEQAEGRGTTMYSPLPKPRKGAKQAPEEPHEGDSAAVAAWRQRMVSDQAKAVYRERAATAETVNADAKAHRGLDRLRVRGKKNVTGCAFLFALTYNILRFITLRA